MSSPTLATGRTAYGPGRARHPVPTGDSRPTLRWWRDAAGALTWASMLGVVALWVSGGGLGQMTSLPGAVTSVGRLSGLVASDLLLIQVLLMARIPVVEQAYGQDELVRRHRLVGFWSVNLMVVHVVTILAGYAAASTLGLWGTVWQTLTQDPGVLLAVAGSVALLLVAITSIRLARRNLRYESWHLLHLYAYLGVGLALPHQLWAGSDFTASPVAATFWWSLYAAAVGAVLVFRVGLPLVRSLRHRLVVADVVHESPGVTSVVMTGRRLDRLGARAGQFLDWRFADGRPGWSRAHPFSLSAPPDGQTLRITAAHVGDGTARLAALRPGTRVWIEGPYGQLHLGTRTRDKVLLLGSGIGITPLRALLEAWPKGAPGDVVIAHRAHGADDLVLADEIAAIARARGARAVPVLGPRRTDRPSWLPASATGVDDSDALWQLCPDLLERDLYLCGNPAWLDALIAAARRAGVAEAQLHVERFTY